MPNTDTDELVLETDTAGKLFSLIDIYKHNGQHTKGHPYLDLETQIYSQKVYKYQLNEDVKLCDYVNGEPIEDGPKLTDWEKIVADKLSKRMNQYGL